MRGALDPAPGVLCKLASIVVHVEELMSPDGHQLDRVALYQLLNDPEVKDWIAAMDRMALVPKKRRA